MPTLTIKKSDKPEKKYKALIKYNDKQDKPKVVYFGSSNYLDYTIGATEQQRKSYRARHNKEKSQKYDTAGALSYYILWGDSRNIKENIKSYKKRYNLK